MLQQQPLTSLLMLTSMPLLALALLFCLVHPRQGASCAAGEPLKLTAQASRRNVNRNNLKFATPPLPLNLSFSGTTGTQTRTSISPPVLNVTSLTGSGTVSSSGSEVNGMNGVYTLSPTLDSHGNEYWTKSGYYCFWDGVSTNSWWINESLGSIGQGSHLSGSYAAGPKGSYAGGAGNPAQWNGSGVTITSFVPNQALTIAGLSGGAANISNVVTTATATTFTISRTIFSAEAGGTFYSAAGDFSDSANPVNLTTAFPIPITASMFGVIARRLPPIYF